MNLLVSLIDFADFFRAKLMVDLRAYRPLFSPYY